MHIFVIALSVLKVLVNIIKVKCKSHARTVRIIMNMSMSQTVITI